MTFFVNLFQDYTIISFNDSPDLSRGAGINVYRGCEHGCVYCYARTTHEYLSLSAGLDFETKIFVKPDAPKLLYKKLASKNWEPQKLMLSGNTDPYQPIEKKLKLTRQCLEVLREFRNPVDIVTKNNLVTRDIDILSDLAEYNASAVFLSVTTLDNKLASVMEPRTSKPHLKFKAIEALAESGIPAGVMIAPVIPGLTD
ncbi:MAG TPA: radical SAM protein, partial [Bacteroidales bacterium]|nr:radical SAM protein [Bacteroidales bacterium]